MKNINSLAKIIFFFFVITSLSLVTVSCNKDDDEECSCSGEAKEKDVLVKGFLGINKYTGEFVVGEMKLDGFVYHVHNVVCNIQSVKDFYYTNIEDYSEYHEIPVICHLDIISDCGYETTIFFERIEDKKVKVKSITLNEQ